MAKTGCDNPPLSENWILSLLSKNPTFENLCVSLEQAGYKFQRIPFARALLEQVDSSKFKALTDAVSASELPQAETTGVYVQEKSILAQPNSGNFLGHKKSPSIPQKELLARDKPPLGPGDKHNFISAPSTTAINNEPSEISASSARAVSYSQQVLLPTSPTPQTTYASPEQQELAQPDKQFVSPHLLWHGPPSKDPQHHPQPLFFNNDISYFQDTHLDSGLSRAQWNPHKTLQSVHLSEAESPQPSYDGIVTNLSLHPWIPAAVCSNQPHSVPFVQSSAPVVKMAPLTGVAGMNQLTLPAQGATTGLSEQPVPDAILENGMELGKASPALIDNQKIVKKISRRKAARSLTYDPKTIARDVLLATGRHPHMAPLNNHMLPLLSIMGVYMDKGCDLETLRWDLIDPVPVGSAKVIELVDDNEDLVIGDLVPDTNTQTTEQGSLLPQAPEPGGHHWNKAKKDKRDADSRMERAKKKKIQMVGGTTVEEKVVKALVSPKDLSRPSSRGKAPRRRASLGGLLDSTIVAHKAAKTDTNQNRRATIGGPGVGKGKTFATRKTRMRAAASTQVPGVTSPSSPAATSSWASVNNLDGAITPSRSRLAAVVIHSRSPSLFDPNGDPFQARSAPKRKNDGSVSDRPRKRGATGKTDSAGSSSHPAPLSGSYRCLWKDCRANPLSFEKLKNHVFKTHKNMASYGGYPCLWEECSRPSTANEIRKGRASDIKEEQYMDFNTGQDLEDHLNGHLGILGEIAKGENGVQAISG